jgi:hypothetical protein
MEPIQVEPAEPAPRQNFIFKRLPAWMRSAASKFDGEKPADSKSGSKDDFELPEWLQ